MEKDELFETIRCANFMDIERLLELLCSKVASILFDMDNEQIKEYLEIETDLTQKQIEDIREEVKWAEEALPK